MRRLLYIAILSAVFAVAANAQASLEGTKEAISDTAITARIETLFAVNEHLSPFNINTTTAAGVVTLTGSVSDDVQKLLATDLAKTVDGVTDVKNELTVVGTVVSQRPPKTWRQKIDDASLTAAIRSNLLWNRELKGLNIGVENDGGNVTIFGVVGNEFAKQSIEICDGHARCEQSDKQHHRAHGDKGGSATTAVTRAVSDDVVAARVKSNLLVNRYVTTRNLNVKVSDGLCILTGTVDSEAQREAAANLAASISGVASVQNDLKVYVPPAPTAAPPAP